MSAALQTAIDELEIELEAIDQKRGDIEHAIGALTRLAREGLTTNGTGTGGTPSSRRSKNADPVKRTKSPRAAAASADVSEPGRKILAALKDGSAHPSGDLSRALGYSSSSALMYHAKPLIKARLIVRFKNGNQSMLSLPGKTAGRGDL